MAVWDRITIEDDVFIGPFVVFTNDIDPRAFRKKNKDEFLPTVIKKGATIGANATIICGITIGKYAFIGAGAVVTRSVPDYAIVYGNLAKQKGYICKCGKKLDANFYCARCRTTVDIADE